MVSSSSGWTFGQAWSSAATSENWRRLAAGEPAAAVHEAAEASAGTAFRLLATGLDELAVGGA